MAKLKLQKNIVIGVGTIILAFVSLYWSLGTNETKEAIVQERTPSNNPLEDSIELFVGGVYKTGVDVLTVPFELVKNFIIRSKIKDFVKDLPIEKPIKKRIIKRINKKDFVDEVVPFLLTLRDQYTAPEKSEHLKFENYISKAYGATNWPAGFEHSLFQFQSAKKEIAAAGDDESAGKGFKFDKNIIAKLVEVYDLLFIQTDISPLKGDVEITPQLLVKMKVIIEGLLRHFLAQMDPESEIAKGINGVIATDDRLETVTISLIQAVNWMAKKNFKMFAQKAYRARDLRVWLHDELNKNAGGQLFNYMRYALRERRYGFQVAVDGLQGQLMESLSQQHADDPFIKQIYWDTDKTNFIKPQARKVSEPAGQQIQFLEALQKKPYNDKRYLPFFRELYTDSINTIAMQGVSTTPTISVRNLPIIKTGTDVVGPTGGTGIPNFHFVDREIDRAYYFFGNDALQLESLAQTAGMKTMFTRLTGFTNLNCNAQYDDLAHKSYDALLNLGLGEKIRDFGDRLCYLELKRRLKTEIELRSIRRDILEYEKKLKSGWKASIWLAKKRMRQQLNKLAALEDEGLPQYVLYYNPWPDHFAHFKGPFSDEIIGVTGELNRLDYWLNLFSQVYKNAGVYDRTMFAMAGDHGLTPVFYLVNPEIEIFDAMKERGINVIVEKISSDEGEGPKMNNPLNPPSVKNKDVVIASTAGGNYMFDFFIDHNSKWKTQPVYKDLTSLRLLSGATVNMIDEIINPLSETIDYLVVRESLSNFASATVRVIGVRAGKKQTTLIYRRGNKIFVKGNISLLGLDEKSRYKTLPDTKNQETLFVKCIENAVQINLGSWCTENEWRELSLGTEKPDAVVQLARIYDSDRAGTINLFPKQGYGYNSKVPGRHAGEHFHEKDAFVGFWGGSVKSAKRIASCVNGSLAPQLYEHLTGRAATRWQDGCGFERCLGAAP